MCHNLLLNYRLYEKMDVFVSCLAFMRPLRKRGGCGGAMSAVHIGSC